ncbi:MAG: hypothetical protein ABSB82_20365 [Terriglobia bacterium]|jgi:hypothetical protein
MSAPTFITLVLSNQGPGNFTLQHGLGRMPIGVIILPIGGTVWGQHTPFFDPTNLYLVASDVVSGKVIVW